MNLRFLNSENKLREYWNQKTLLFANQTQLSESLPRTNQLVRLLTGHFDGNVWKKPINVSINASSPRVGENIHQHFALDVERAMDLFENGFTLCLSDLTPHIDTLERLKDEAVEIFGYPESIVVTGYLSPKGASGVLHFDRQHNFFIQVEGSKVWTVSNIHAVKNPFENLVYTNTTESFFNEMAEKGYRIRLPRECGRRELTLTPGDVLYLPPGFYHSAQTENQSSLHYTLTIEPVCFWKEHNQNLFDKLLSSDGYFFQDYRFLTTEERKLLSKYCIDLLKSKDF
jgi:hypothetical protein